MTFRVCLIGNGTIAARGLAVLHAMEGVEVVCVVGDAGDSGEDTWRESFVKKALELSFEEGVSLFQPKNPNSKDMLEVYQSMQLDMVLSLQCRSIIRSQLIAIPKLGVVNLHNAPLPLLRGCDPFAWAIHDGLQMMGISLHQVPDEGIDAGAVYAQKYWEITPETTAFDLYNEAIVQGEQLLMDSLLAILNGDIQAVPQDPKLTTYHPMGQFPYDRLEADFCDVAASLSQRLRSLIFPPFQVPYVDMAGTTVYIHACRKGEMYGKMGQRGDVLAIDSQTGAVTIGCKYGSIDLLQLALEKGGQPSPASDVLAILGHKEGTNLLPQANESGESSSSSTSTGGSSASH